MYKEEDNRTDPFGFAGVEMSEKAGDGWSLTGSLANTGASDYRAQRVRA
jgi:hypothetical protein